MKALALQTLMSIYDDLVCVYSELIDFYLLFESRRKEILVVYDGRGWDFSDPNDELKILFVDREKRQQKSFIYDYTEYHQKALPILCEFLEKVRKTGFRAKRDERTAYAETLDVLDFIGGIMREEQAGQASPRSQGEKI
jgi:hypothetical protein